MKSKDPDCKMPVGKDQFRCYKCELPVPSETGGWNEVEAGLEFKACNDCYKVIKEKKNDGQNSSEKA